MYAIIKTGGKQYKVAEGDVIDVEKLDAQPGDKVDLDVLLLNDGTSTIVPSEGNFYQTENQYQTLIYYRSPVDRTDRLVGYGYTK